jgi:hypothetical protein
MTFPPVIDFHSLYNIEQRAILGLAYSVCVLSDVRIVPEVFQQSSG